MYEAFCKICERWEVEPTYNLPIDTMMKFLGVSLGLGDLFNDDVEAERQWLRRKREELGGETPISELLSGEQARVDRVVSLVEWERGLR